MKTTKHPSLTKTLAHYYRPHLGLFLSDMTAALLVAVGDLFYPLLTRGIINNFVPNRNFRMMLVWAGALFVIYLAKAGLNYYMQSWGHIMGVRMQADMRRDLFRHMQKLPFSYFDEHKTGSLMSRIVNDLMEITELAHHGPEDLFISLISLIGAFIMLATINLPLTLIIFSAIPILVLFNVIMRLRMASAFRRRRETTAEINAEIQNSLSGIRVAKAFSNADYEESKFSNRTSDYVEASSHAYKVMGVYNSGVTLLTDLLELLALVASAIFVFMGKINIGDFVAFLLYVTNFTKPIRRLNMFVEQFQDGMSGFRRFSEIMGQNTEENPVNPKSPKVLKGDIRFQDVCFTYGDENTVLNHINLHIPAGKTLAVVGPSGGGKTTLCHLIPRFYIPQSGEILLDGVDVQDFDYAELRNSVGIVQQDVFIFTGSIRENIAYGNLNATEEEIIQAAKNADLHDFILTLPNGYNTQIGERGAKLSGGQKQRVSIARVFLKNPPILILDEATSALDNLTEQAIQKSFDLLRKNRTTLVVAHRLSTVRNADEIVVLTDQGIEEKGTHDELMAHPQGLYKFLYETQFTGL